LNCAKIFAEFGKEGRKFWERNGRGMGMNWKRKQKKSRKQENLFLFCLSK
jgi:hypothetical protein